MRRSTFLLAALLTASLAGNALLLLRRAPTPRPAPHADPGPLQEEIHRLRVENAELRTRASRVGRPAPPSPVQPAEAPPDLWTELGRLHASTEIVDDNAHLHRMAQVTADHLGLEEAERFRFVAAAKAVHLDVVRAEVERQKAALAGEPEDRIDTEYRRRIASAAEFLRSSLDPARPRNAEFGRDVERWFRYFRVPGR